MLVVRFNRSYTNSQISNFIELNMGTPKISLTTCLLVAFGMIDGYGIFNKIRSVVELSSVQIITCWH